MELIVISKNKLKIMLTAPDMIHYDLEATCMECANPRTRAAFRHIFDDARNQIGFQTEGERLYIQFFASREGGCEIFVTKMGNNSLPIPPTSMEEEPLNKADDSLPALRTDILTKGERTLLERVHALGKEEGMGWLDCDPALSQEGTREVAWIFDRLEDILMVCHRLLRDGYRGRSTAYADDDAHTARWYLFLEFPNKIGYRLTNRYAHLTEYGKEVDSSGAMLYLSEYGHCICRENAIGILGKLSKIEE